MLHVYMLGSTAAGLDNKPADLLGYGPITADHARAITENAELMRILLDPFTRDIRSIDTPAYRIPKVLRWAAQARDKTCTFPGCAVPADETEIDHMIPHPFARKIDKALAHGTTTLTNLTSLCKRHHRAKTHAGWIIEATESGDWLNWIAPTGHHYRRLAHWGPPKGFWTDHQEHLMRTSASDPAPF